MNTKELIAAEIAKVVPELEQENIQNLLEIPKNADMGDLAFPAFSLAKVLRKAPQMIAADIAEKIDASNFEKVEAVGPYINIFLDKSKISADVLGQVIAQGSHYADQNIGNGRSIAFDMSSPNIAKPFSIGHLRSTVIADALANIVANKVTNQSASITWATGVNNLVCLLLPIRNGVARKLSKPILSMNSFNFMCVSMPKLKKTHL